ncbi:MAG TPA: cell division protein FtsA [Candidatus Saccharibacteria bacterium]|nr:cell division protein FtsA [Candidatus Saccharibacteria bacterium]
MRETHATQHFVGVDVGTSKVRVVVGTVDEAGRPEIIGFSEAENTGMRRGVVAHTDEVAVAITNALQDAERLSGRHITSATININGAHVQGFNSRGVIAISAANREITIDDRMRVEEAAAVMQLPANREIIQVFPKAYRLDGQDNIKDPIGMQGVRLEVDTHIVTASTPNIKLLETSAQKSSLVIKHRTVSSLASAEAVLTRQQKEAGTAVVDIGAGTTNLVVVEDDEVQHVAVIPVGGMHVTNDLAIGLKTDLDIAERVKVEFASLAKPSRATYSVIIDKHQHTFDADEVHMVIEARIEELFELIDKELKRIGKSRKLPGGIIFTGGTAHIKDLADFAREKLELPARIGKIQELSGLADVSENITFATPIGLMLLDMLLDGQHAVGHPNDYSGVVDNISSLFKRFKKR